MDVKTTSHEYARHETSLAQLVPLYPAGAGVSLRRESVTLSSGHTRERWTFSAVMPGEQWFIRSDDYQSLYSAAMDHCYLAKSEAEKVV